MSYQQFISEHPLLVAGLWVGGFVLYTVLITWGYGRLKAKKPAPVVTPPAPSSFQNAAPKIAMIPEPTSRWVSRKELEDQIEAIFAMAHNLPAMGVDEHGVNLRVWSDGAIRPTDCAALDDIQQPFEDVFLKVQERYTRDAVIDRHGIKPLMFELPSEITTPDRMFMPFHPDKWLGGNKCSFYNFIVLLEGKLVLAQQKVREMESFKIRSEYSTIRTFYANGAYIEDPSVPLAEWIAMPALTAQVIQRIKQLGEPTSIWVYRSKGYLNLQVEFGDTVIVVSDAGAFFYMTDSMADVFTENLATELQAIGYLPDAGHMRVIPAEQFPIEQICHFGDRTVTRFVDPRYSLKKPKGSWEICNK